MQAVEDGNEQMPCENVCAIATATEAVEEHSKAVLQGKCQQRPVVIVLQWQRGRHVANEEHAEAAPCSNHGLFWGRGLGRRLVLKSESNHRTRRVLHRTKVISIQYHPLDTKWQQGGKLCQETTSPRKGTAGATQ